MLKRITIFLLVILVTGNSAYAQWLKIADFKDAIDDGIGPPIFSEFISSVYFLDLPGPPRIGFVGGFPDFWRTSDGGKSWLRVWKGPNTQDAWASDICFKDSLTGWFAYQPASYVFRTTDGGLSWHQVPYPLTNKIINGIHYCATSHRLFVGSYFQMSESTDLGLTWSVADTNQAGFFSFFSDSEGIASAYWIDTLHYIDTLHDISDSSDGILRTTDGGLHWSITSARFTTTQPLAIPGTSTCFAATAGRLRIERSDDYGQTWHQVYDFGPFQDSNGNRIGPYGMGYIIGDLSKLIVIDDSTYYTSTDQGASWQMGTGVSGGYYEPLYTRAGYTFAGLIYGSGSSVTSGGLWEEDSEQSGVTLPTPAEAANLSIYPNPTTGLVTITGASGPVTVTNVLGESVLTANPDHPLSPSFERRGDSSSGLSLDLSGLPAGVYYISDGVSRTKLVKE